MAIITEAQIHIKSQNPFEAKSKIESIKSIAKLDGDVLSKLAKLARNEKAIHQIKYNFEMIESFLG